MLGLSGESAEAGRPAESSGRRRTRPAVPAPLSRRRPPASPCSGLVNRHAARDPELRDVARDVASFHEEVRTLSREANPTDEVGTDVRVIGAGVGVVRMESYSSTDVRRNPSLGQEVVVDVEVWVDVTNSVVVPVGEGRDEVVL